MELKDRYAREWKSDNIRRDPDRDRNTKDSGKRTGDMRPR